MKTGDHVSTGFVILDIKLETWRLFGRIWIQSDFAYLPRQKQFSLADKEKELDLNETFVISVVTYSIKMIKCLLK